MLSSQHPRAFSWQLQTLPRTPHHQSPGLGSSRSGLSRPQFHFSATLLVTVITTDKQQLRAGRVHPRSWLCKLPMGLGCGSWWEQLVIWCKSMRLLAHSWTAGWKREKLIFFFCLFPPIQAPNMKSVSVHLSDYSSTDGQELIHHHVFPTVMEVISRSMSQINLSFLELLPVGYLATAMRK